jgi:TPR repeat protein
MTTSTSRDPIYLIFMLRTRTSEARCALAKHRSLDVFLKVVYSRVSKAGLWGLLERGGTSLCRRRDNHLTKVRDASMKVFSLMKRWTWLFMLFLVYGITATLLISCSKSNGGLAIAPPEMLRALTLEFDPDAIDAEVGRALVVAEYDKACKAGYGPACKYKTWDRPNAKAHERLEAAYNLFGNKCTDDASDPGACLVMAWYLSQDPPGMISSTSEDPQKAQKIFRKLCNAKVGAACSGLGKLLILGVGAVQSETESIKYYYKGCRLDYAPGCNAGSWMKYTSLEPDDNEGKDEARETMVKACALDPLFCTNTGDILGTTKELSPEQQVSFYRKNCKVGSMRACYILGLNHRDGDGTPKNKERAAELFRQTCDERFDVGCVELGFGLNNGVGVEKDVKKAAELFRQGCSGGVALGCHNLAFAYHDGKGVDENASLATEYYEAACKLKRAGSCQALAGRHYDGVGAVKDKDKAMSFMVKACEYGGQRGCELGGYPLADRKKYFARYNEDGGSPGKMETCVLNKIETHISLRDFRRHLARGTNPEQVSTWIVECVSEK